MAKNNKKLTRELDAWVENWLRYTDPTPSPEIFRKWAAYSIISGAMERRTWIKMMGKTLHPNLFIILTAPPGVGKNAAADEAETILRRTGRLRIAPAGMTKAALIDEYAESEPSTFEHDGHTFMTHPLQVLAPEFGIFMPDYDTRFISLICDVYDCRGQASDKTRQKGTIIIDRPHLNLLAGVTPKALGGILPEIAYGQGFMSRVILVYHGVRVVKSLFDNSELDKTLFKSLLNDLKSICNLVGPFSLTKACEGIMEDWNRNMESDQPKHPRLQNYNTRRIIHATKLAMVMSVSEGNQMIIGSQHFESARDALLKAERLMPQVFQEMATSEDANEVTQIHQYVHAWCMDNGEKAIPEHILFQFMSQRVAVNKILFFLNTMISAGLLESSGLNIDGERKFIPVETSIYHNK